MSDDRLKLRRAIDALAAANERPSRLDGARLKLRQDSGAAIDALDAAEEVLRLARASNSAEYRAAVILGEIEPGDVPPTVEQAKAVLADAQAGMDAIDARRTTIREADQVVSNGIEAAKHVRDAAIGELLAPRAALLVEELRACWAREESLRCAIGAVFRRLPNAIPANWDARPGAVPPDRQMADWWLESVARLETDADAPLPPPPTSGITTVERRIIDPHAKVVQLPDRKRAD